MIYTNENIAAINDKYKKIDYVYLKLTQDLLFLQSKLNNEKTIEYLTTGVGRRLNILNRCLHNVFKIFPVEKTDLLEQNDLTDLYINLHAFFINISGIIDNLAWVFIYENSLFGKPKEGKVSEHGVGLFRQETQKYLNAKLNEYLLSDRMQKWHTEYCKNYRDALVHRIPLYVPPVALDEEEQEKYILLEKKLWDFSSFKNIMQHDKIREEQSWLGRACTVFAHCLSEGKPMCLHAQVIADFVTIEEIIKKFCKYFKNDI